MKKLLAFTALTVGLANGAIAADRYEPEGRTATPAPIWTGFYVGGHGGWATGDWDGKLETTAGNPPDNYAGYDNPFKLLDGSGWHGGAQFGYNRQIGDIVFGVEVDGSWTNFDGSETYTTDDYNGDYAKKHSFELDYFGTTRARVGLALGRFMPYATGGLAIGRSNGEVSISYPNAAINGTSDASATQNHIGWALGAGLEAAFAEGWSVKAEFLRVNLGKQDYDFKGSVYNGDPFETDSFDSDLAFNVFRVGLNRRF